MGVHTGYFNLLSVVDGERGNDGRNGARMRVRIFTDGDEYLSGRGSEEWYDIVYMPDNLRQRYLCVKTLDEPAKMGVNDPVTSIKNHLGCWVAAQEWAFVASDLALMRKIKADEIDADGIVARNVDVEGKITATSGSFTGEIYARVGKIGGFTIEDGRLYWKQHDYFGKDSRSLKLGVSTKDDEGVVDVNFNAATGGRFGIKAVGSNMGGAAIYASRDGKHVPYHLYSYAAFLDGGCFVMGNVYAQCYKAVVGVKPDGDYEVRHGVTWNRSKGSPDLDHIRLEVDGGIITGYYRE